MLQFIGDAAAVPPISSLRRLKQTLSDAVTVERSKVGALSVLLNRVERDAQDWYAEATSIYAVGTINGDLIRTIPTTTTYNPATSAAPVPSSPTHNQKRSQKQKKRDGSDRSSLFLFSGSHRYKNSAGSRGCFA